jgi:hypothetical protein
MPHLLGIDIGTSGTKTLVCDEDGTVLATAMAEHPISSPKPGWSEQNPEDWWQATVKATQAVLKKAKLKPGDVGGIGLSGQMHGSVFLADGEKALDPRCCGTTSAPPSSARRSSQGRPGARPDRARRQPRTHRLHRAEDALGAPARAEDLGQGEARAGCPRTTSASA